MNRRTQVALLEEYYELNETKKAAEKRLTEIKKELAYEGPTIVEVNDEVVLEVVEQRRFSPSLAKQVLPPDLYEEICVMTPDSRLAAQKLTGEELDMIKSTSLMYTFKENK